MKNDPICKGPYAVQITGLPRLILRTMRISVFLLLGCVLTSYATGYSQDAKLTLKLKNVRLSEVFRTIQKQTDYQFLYNDEDVQNAPLVSVIVKEGTVPEILAACFANYPLSYRIENKTVVVFPKRKQPAGPESPVATEILSFIVKGHISSSSGEPLIGANISLKGTQTGAISDNDGNYTITLPDGNGILVFSFVGYSPKEVQVNGKANINVSLAASISGLDQFVVIGYGEVKKSDLTGSVTRISRQDIESAPVASVDQALQGKAAGVQVTSVNGAPGAGTSIRIRGGNSISGSNEPLYVIDGFIGAGNLTSVDPGDIESVEILKDASATAIYGSRGANGVILITTKRGRKGKTNVAASFYMGAQQLPKEVNLLTGPQLAEFVNERAKFFGTALIYPDVSKVTNTDWQKEITKTANIQNANVSFSGGSDKATYYLSGNYFNQDGIILNSGFKRYQTRLNLNLKLTDWLSVGTNLNLNRSNTSNNKVNLYDVLKSAPTSLPVFDSAGNYSILSPLSGQTFENPVATAKMSLNNTYYNSLLGSWYAEASFKNGLRFKSTLGINNGNTDTKQYLPGALPLRSAQKVGGYASISSMRVFNLLNENTISYNTSFGKHRLNVLGGFTYQHETNESYSAIAQGFTNDLLTYNNLNTGNPLLAVNNSNTLEWTMISLLGRVNYSFNNKYLFTASARQDGSSRLATNNKYAFFHRRHSHGK